MLRILATGKQNFFDLRQNNCFYVDKTKFIIEWWKSQDDVTLITRPRRFGKTLMLDTVNTFFSPEFAGQSELFEGLEVWKDEHFHSLQGTIPVISLSFADIKSDNCSYALELINARLTRIYNRFSKFLDFTLLTQKEHEQFDSVCIEMKKSLAQDSLCCLAEYLVRNHFPKPIILLDEYDTPLQEAWIHGYWDELLQFIRGFFNSTFKTNPYLGRGLLTGITRIAKESIFSDLNNLQVVSTTSELYTDCFGFTESEVFAAMDEYGIKNKDEVKQWYDGFIFGNQKEIYNPWSIISYLSKNEIDYYWIDTSSNALVGEIIAHGDTTIKEETELLLQGKSITTTLDEQVSFSQIYTDNGAIWSLLMATGYVKPLAFNKIKRQYQLALTNLECHYIFETRIAQWFSKVHEENNEFIQALLNNDLDQMNVQMMEITENIFSFFDMRKNKKKNSENFYHAFVLGLIVNLKNRYTIRSNRESGYGRYDICMFPNQICDPGIVIEFKVFNQNKEKNLQETCQNALMQIKEKKYINELLAHNISSSNLYIYGFAFNGKEVCICGGQNEKIDR